MSNIGLVIFAFSFILILVLFRMMELRTIVDKKTITVQYSPFFTKHFDIRDIQKASIATYGFVGYGIKISLKYGTIYNVKGNKGLVLLMNSGKKFLIGTQKPQEIQRVIDTLLKTL